MAARGEKGVPVVMLTTVKPAALVEWAALERIARATRVARAREDRAVPAVMGGKAGRPVKEATVAPVAMAKTLVSTFIATGMRTC